MSIYNRYDILTEFAKKKKSNVRTCLNGAKDATGASQTFDAAKVQINSGITKQKLENLKEKYKNTTNPYGFLTDLQIAMGLPRVKRASNYGIVTIPKADGTAAVSIRISNHSTNAGTYITNNANQEYNLSIVVRKRARKKTFIPHDDVRLDEYIYYGNRLRNVESPLVQIINSIIGFLDSGMYIDTTGVALHNTSPQQPTNENNQNTKINKNMKKQTIKLNESQLRKMINESLNEFIGGIGPGARYGNKNFNVKTLINEVEITLNEIDRQCDYLIKLSSQLPGDVFNNNFDSELNRYAGNIGALNQELINKFWESIKGVQINESKLRNIIGESIKKALKESNNEFNYSDTEDLGNGRHRQTIIYGGKEIGYLLSIEKNWLSQIEEIYVLPDIDNGMQYGEPGSGLLDGKKGWIDFRTFKDYNEALSYASQNLEKLAYLFEYGDYD